MKDYCCLSKYLQSSFYIYGYGLNDFGLMGFDVKQISLNFV